MTTKTWFDGCPCVACAAAHGAARTSWSFPTPPGTVPEWATCREQDEDHVYNRIAWPVCPTCAVLDPSAELVRFMRGRAQYPQKDPQTETWLGTPPTADLMETPYLKTRPGVWI